MNLLEVNNLTKSFDNGKTLTLDSISFTIESGKVLAIVGESGSGKTTLIRLISGLETPDAGHIKLNGQVMSSLTTMVPPERRVIGMVFQEYALFPHLTIYDNIVYGIAKRKDKKDRAAEVLKLVGLQGYEKRYPHQLSGGQQQRVALARAIAPNPALLILDEPFSNLDTILRDQLRREIFEIITKTGITAIFVTHDTEDALSVSDHIMVLQEGKRIQEANSEQLFQYPKSAYVASLFSAVVGFSVAQLQAFGVQTKDQHTYMVRTHAIRINETTDYSTTVIVVKAIFMGDHYHLHVQMEDQSVIMIYASKAYQNEIQIGFMGEDVLCFPV